MKLEEVGGVLWPLVLVIANRFEALDDVDFVPDAQLTPWIEFSDFASVRLK